MELDRNVEVGVKELMLKLEQHLAADQEGNVAATLQRVATGEMAMPETIETAERAYVQAVFAWVAAVGPRKLFAGLEPLFAKVLAVEEATPAAGHPSVHATLESLLATASADGFPLPPPAEKNPHSLERLAILLLSYIFYDEFHFPQAETGTYDVAGDMFQKAKWVYRYWFNQLEVTEQQSELAGVLASQDLRFPATSSDARRVTVSCAGDLLAVDVLVPENCPHLFDGIADFFSTADIVSANLESTVDSERPVGRTQAAGEAARMNTSEAMFRKFRDEAKINFFSTATNHALDWDEHGVLATLDVLAQSGADYSGTAASQAEQDDVVVVDKNGIKIALLTFTFDLNDHRLPSGKSYLVNEVRFNDAEPAPDFSMVKRHVATARAKGADYIIAYCHWGWEFEMYPHVNVVDAAHEVIACGVDTILGNHPHVSQPMQRVVRDGKPDSLIVYAFGDFVSYHPESRNSKLAYSIKFDIVQEKTSSGSRTYLANLKMLPMYLVNAEGSDGSFDCRIVKFADVYRRPDDYGLTELEKSQLPHLQDAVLNRILLPKDAGGMVADEDG